MTGETALSMESPEYMRMSLAAAMTLGFKPGLFYRNAKLYCINLLLTYGEGCRARCAYCGLSGSRPGRYSRKSFIRVTWPTYSLEEIAGRIGSGKHNIKRICISMVSRKRAVDDTLKVCERLRRAADIPVSLLIAPTVLNTQDLIDFRSAGADKIGVAIDLATPALFDRYRGQGVGGPHRWGTYWKCLENAIRLFGNGNAGSHFMVGMGESEQDMCGVIQEVRDLGGRTHLFSFYPENGSLMSEASPPSMDQYRRIQLARYLIDNRIACLAHFSFDASGRLTDYGLPRKEVDAVIDSGEPFRTSGCTGRDNEVACNRPYGNSRPGPDIRNYPFPPDPIDIHHIRCQMGRAPDTIRSEAS